MDITELEFWVWQNNLQQQEWICMGNSNKYFKQVTNYHEYIEKFNGYAILIGEMKNFSNLFRALFESEEDIQEIFCLLLGGHYKSCLVLLRTHLELSNGIIRAIKSNQPIKNFEEKRNAEGVRKFLIKPLNISKEWETDITTLYSELSSYTHPDGRKTGHFRLNPLPQPEFKRESFDYCLQKIDEVIDHNAGLLKKCLKSDLWKKDLLVDLLGKEFEISGLDSYEKKAIKNLYKNIHQKIVLKEISNV